MPPDFGESCVPSEAEGYPHPRLAKFPRVTSWVVLAPVLLSACGMFDTTWRAARGTGKATYAVGETGDLRRHRGRQGGLPGGGLHLQGGDGAAGLAAHP